MKLRAPPSPGLVQPKQKHKNTHNANLFFYKMKTDGIFFSFQILLVPGSLAEKGLLITNIFSFSHKFPCKTNTLPSGIFSVSSCPLVPRAMKINRNPPAPNIFNEPIILWLLSVFPLAPNKKLLFIFLFFFFHNPRSFFESFFHFRLQ